MISTTTVFPQMSASGLVFRELWGNFDPMKEIFEAILEGYYHSFRYLSERYFVYQQKEYYCYLKKDNIFVLQDKECYQQRTKEKKLGIKLADDGSVINIFLEGKISYKDGVWYTEREKKQFEDFWQGALAAFAKSFDFFYQQNQSDVLLLNIRRAHLSKSLAEHLDLLALTNPSNLDVCFLSEEGADAGGLRRDYIRLIFNHLRGNLSLVQFQINPHNHFLEPCFQKGQLPSLRLQAIGKILSLAYLSSFEESIDGKDRSLLIGKQFDKKIFKALFLCSENLIEGFEGDYLEIILALKPHLAALEKDFCDLSEAEIKIIEESKGYERGSLSDESWPNYKDELISENTTDAVMVLEIAKGFKEHIEMHGGEYFYTWDNFRSNMQEEAFERIVQGTIDRGEILEKIFFTKEVAHCQEWFASWMLEASEEHLIKFLNFVVASDTLGPEMQINVEDWNPQQPVVSTCDRIFRVHPEAKNIKQNFFNYLDNLIEYEGFDCS